MDDRTPNATAASLLGFLHRGPMSGWDLAATAQTSIGDFWTVTRSQVYRELAWMDEAGLVQAGERGARERRPYTLTDRGREAFAAWVAREPGPETIRFPLLLTMAFGGHLEPGQLAGFVRLHRAVHAARLARYEATMGDPDAGPPDVYGRSTLQFGIEYERAVLRWFDSLPAEVRGDDPDDQG
jgi:DNA-binding PadR family transcriptional regulator